MVYVAKVLWRFGSLWSLLMGSVYIWCRPVLSLYMSVKDTAFILT